MSPALEPEKAEAASEFFRCPVQAEQSRGKIKIGHRRFDAKIQEASIQGFTVLVEPKHAKRLAVGIPWVLEYGGAIFEIQAQWFFHSPDGHIQVGLRRLRDLTPPERVARWWGLGDSSRAIEDAGHSTLAFAGFILVVFVTMAMPGLGDQLGTAKRINAAFEWIVSGLEDRIDHLWH